MNGARERARAADGAKRKRRKENSASAERKSATAEENHRRVFSDEIFEIGLEGVWRQK